MQQFSKDRVLSFFGPISTPATTVLRTALCSMVNEGAAAVTILFASDGGSTSDGIALHNYLRSLPIEITMHAVGVVGSIAVPVFLAAKKRLAVDSAQFFFHEFHWTDKDADRVTHATILERTLLLNHAINWTKDLLKAETKLTDADFDSMKLFDHPLLMDAPMAMQKGVIQATGVASMAKGLDPRTVHW